jgi:hypothetical protein
VEDGDMIIGETAQLNLMTVTMSDGRVVRVSHEGIHPETVVGVIITTTRWIVTTKVVAGGTDGMQGALIRPVEPSVTVDLVVSQARHMIIIQL